MMGAAILATPEIELDKEEAKKLGDAIKDVGKHYSMLFDPKHVAIANLMATAGFLYGPRIVAYRVRRKAERGPENVRKPVPIESRRSPEPKPEKAEPIVPTAQAPNGRTGSAQMSPSQLWPEPAGEFPGLG